MRAAGSNKLLPVLCTVLPAVILLLLPPDLLAASLPPAAPTAWWIWVLLLFVFSFFLESFPFSPVSAEGCFLFLL